MSQSNIFMLAVIRQNLDASNPLVISDISALELSQKIELLKRRQEETLMIGELDDLQDILIEFDEEVFTTNKISDEYRSALQYLSEANLQALMSLEKLDTKLMQSYLITQVESVFESGNKTPQDELMLLEAYELIEKYPDFSFEETELSVFVRSCLGSNFASDLEESDIELLEEMSAQITVPGKVEVARTARGNIITPLFIGVVNHAISEKLTYNSFKDRTLGSYFGRKLPIYRAVEDGLFNEAFDGIEERFKKLNPESTPEEIERNNLNRFTMFEHDFKKALTKFWEALGNDRVMELFNMPISKVPDYLNQVLNEIEPSKKSTITAMKKHIIALVGNNGNSERFKHIPFGYIFSLFDVNGTRNLLSQVNFSSKYVFAWGRSGSESPVVEAIRFFPTEI